MVKIILLLFFIGASSLFEYLKKRRQEREESSHPSDSSDSSDMMTIKANPFAQFFKAGAIAAANQQPGRRPHVRPNQSPDLDQEVPDYKSTTKNRKTPQPFLPGELHQSPFEMPPMPEKTLTDLDEVNDTTVSAQNNPNDDTERHYARWRQAIIDSAIITPKFRTPD